MTDVFWFTETHSGRYLRPDTITTNNNLSKDIHQANQPNHIVSGHLTTQEQYLCKQFASVFKFKLSVTIGIALYCF